MSYWTARLASPGNQPRAFLHCAKVKLMKKKQDDQKIDIPVEAKLGFPILEAAAVAGVGRSTIYEEIKAGRLIARKARGRTIILPEDLRAWLVDLPVMEAKGASQDAA